jgi:signal transduction histidine kinase
VSLLETINGQYDIKTLVIVFILVMFVLFITFLLAFITHQRKKFQYQHNLLNLKEAQQNQLIEAAVRSEETERHRIAETLHDEVGAILSSAKLHLQGIKLNTLDHRDQQLYEKGKTLLDDGIQKVRGISHNLHSNILKQFGLNDAIHDFVTKTLKGSMIEVSINLDNTYHTQNPENDISIYRMVQELVNNIVKYAHAREMVIGSQFSGNLLSITIEHNGTGLTQQQFEALRYKKEGLGLKNIQNRVILLKGSIGFLKKDNNYLININIPINQQSL